MPTYSSFATTQMNATGITFCSEGASLIGSHTIEDAYNQPNEEFWMWALFHTNRAVCDALVTTMLGNLWAAGASNHTQIDPVTDQAGYIAWYESIKADKQVYCTCLKALALGARIVAGDMSGLSNTESAFIQMQFVGAYVAAMNDLTGDPEADVKAALKPWFLTQVTLDQFSDGGTYT